MKKNMLFAVCTLALAVGCGAPETEGAGERAQALTTASTTDVVNSVMQAARQLQAATANLNAVLAGAYSVWPSKAEFQRAATVRGYKNDWEALNAVATISGAYAAGAYENPSLDFQDRMQLGGAYIIDPGAAGAYVIGLHTAGAYILPSGYAAGAYAAGSYISPVLERIAKVARE